MRILVFGDSIAHGHNDFDLGGWVSRLNLCTHMEPSFYNLSVSGETTEGAVQRLRSEAGARVPDDGLAILFALGTNDSAIVGGRPWVKADRFGENVFALLRIAKSYTGKVAWVGAPAVDDAKTHPTAWMDSISYTDADVHAYNAIAKACCIAEGVAFISVHDTLAVEDLPDGLHPNTAGHEKIFRRVHESLRKEGWFSEE